MKDAAEPRTGIRIADDVLSYAELKVANMKLGIAEKLSVVAGKAIGTILCAVAVLCAFVFLMVALTLWISELVDSPVYGTLITAGIFILLAIILWFMRHGFANMMVRVFCGLLFDDEDKDGNDEQE